ncbi:glycan-binding surface protein [Labilibaculum sp. K2S]|uniref:glycan-binding surface protein n=1 Tax=Labilibaculum sp. K2S TaxID=3056386 RepID=UPI0025A4C905|nr:glycan-binding surface protein [Labilibaculum sp. K2S]MDM8159974.1 glycan-binding surface protein [Labilibaculum sp. K2S]
MKKIIDTHVRRLLLTCFAAILILLSACEKDIVHAPVITQIRNYEASPNDTLIDVVLAEQWVILEGRNLAGITVAYFNGVRADINSTMLTDHYAVIQIPNIEFQNVSDEARNKIEVVSEGGIGSYEIPVKGAPYISYVRSAADSPNDIIVNVLYPGNQINIIGYNLKDATEISFQGILADLTNVVYTDTSAIVQVPADLSGSDASKANTITYTTKIGEGTFPIKIVGPPVISSVSYEIPREGDQVYLFGYNFVSIQSLVFAGVPITSYEVSANESMIGFIAPALTQSGSVEITTLAGTFTTAYMVNDIDFINAGGVGILANMEWGDYFGWTWWKEGILNSSDPNSGWPPYNADFGEGFGMYLELKSPVLNGGEGAVGNSMYFGDCLWVPTENLDDSGNNWALKFEINVPNAWNGSTICIRTTDDETSTRYKYVARVEPWQITSTKTADFVTSGWQTVTIPLSEFRDEDDNGVEGKGPSITKVSDLLNPASEKSGLIVYLHNYKTSASTSFDGAFDNLRVTKR